MSRTDVKLGSAVVRAYNNWARDYCGESPDRVKFVSVVPGGDAAEVALEARRSVEELGAVSFIMSTPTVGPLVAHSGIRPGLGGRNRA